MRFRKLRIAWSVAWGLAAVLLIALSVWSYRMYTDFNPVGNLWFAWWYGSLSVTSRPSTDLYFEQHRCVIPCWTLVMSAIAIIPVAWIPQRFTCRFLLIATTLVAVELGLIVWLR